MPRVRKMYDSHEDDWVYRRARPTKERIRGRFARKRRRQRERLAYTVPRQGVRVRRTPAQARAEYEEAARRLAYRNTRRHGARPKPQKQRSFLRWLWGR